MDLQLMKYKQNDGFDGIICLRNDWVKYEEIPKYNYKKIGLIKNLQTIELR